MNAEFDFISLFEILSIRLYSTSVLVIREDYYDEDYGDSLRDD
jgi:hypothetical protein